MRPLNIIYVGQNVDAATFYLFADQNIDAAGFLFYFASITRMRRGFKVDAGGLENLQIKFIWP